jgi:hypothetical protein
MLERRADGESGCFPKQGVKGDPMILSKQGDRASVNASLLPHMHM